MRGNIQFPPAMVSREILRCDLDRVKLIIASSKSGIRPTSLKIIEERYLKALRQQRFVRSSCATDQKSIEICDRDGIVLQETFRPIWYVLYNKINLLLLLQTCLVKLQKIVSITLNRMFLSIFVKFCPILFLLCPP